MAKHIQAGHTNISCQTFGDRENERFVLVRLSNYRAADGHMSCGFDLTPDKARELGYWAEVNRCEACIRDALRAYRFARGNSPIQTFGSVYARRVQELRA